MKVVHWITSRFSNRGRALSLYKRGIAKARRRDQPDALDDCTTAIGMPDTLSDIRAMALNHRALMQRPETF